VISLGIETKLMRAPESADQDVIQATREIVEHVEAKKISAEADRVPDAGTATRQTRSPVTGNPGTRNAYYNGYYLHNHESPVAPPCASENYSDNQCRNCAYQLNRAESSEKHLSIQQRLVLH